MSNSLIREMRAAAILGLGCSPKNLTPFQSVQSREIEWRIGMPAVADQVDVILLFGGDGTIHRHLSQLVELGVPVLVVPVGSGNDFARALGLRHVRDSLAAWRKFCGGAGTVREIDLGTITPLATTGGASPPQADTRNSVPGTRYFCCVAGVGLDGEVSRLASRLPRWLRGHGGYALSLIPAIFRFAPFPLRIQAAAAVGGSGTAANSAAPWVLRSDQSTVLAVFANTPVYGGGMKVAPPARMDDGQLDACLVADISRFKLFSLFPSVYFGRHLGMREVDYFQSGRLLVEAERPIDVYADGEYVCRTPVEIAVLGRALNVITP